MKIWHMGTHPDLVDYCTVEDDKYDEGNLNGLEEDGLPPAVDGERNLRPGEPKQLID